MSISATSAFICAHLRAKIVTMKSYSLTLSAIQDETKDAYTLRFATTEAVFSTYKAGQYLTLKLVIKGEQVRRAFSLSSSPATDKDLAVTIKRIEGGKASNYLRNTLKVGDKIDVFPPMGNFLIDTGANNCKHYILIGAGSGITPLMSMLKTVLSVEKNSKITLWYGNSHEESIIFAQELTNLKQQYGSRLNVVLMLSRPSASWAGQTGRLDENNIYSLVSELFMTDEYRKVYYLCGPEGMMKAGQTALEKHGVNPADVHREYFAAPAPTDEEIHEVHGEKPTITTEIVTIILDGETYQVPVPAGQYIVDAAIDFGIDPPYSCQAGICTTCRGLCKSGKVEMDESEGLSDQELREGYVLTCQAKVLQGPVVIEYK